MTVSGPTWPEPLLAQPPEAVATVVRGLWTTADRVDVVMEQPGWLVRVVLTCRPSPRIVRALSPSPSEAQRDWLCWITPEASVPEFMLSYAAASSFPETAILFNGPPSARWATVHRRPLVLYKLRERFEGLLSRAVESRPREARRPLNIAATIREQPDTARIDDRSASPPGAMPEPIHVSAADLYRHVLAAHFANVPDASSREGGRHTDALTAHQQRAYERACTILDRYGGVIISDAVGLGKTYIGLRLLARALEDGGRVLVIVPAALRNQWERDLGYLSPVATNSSDSSDNSTPPAPSNLDLWLNEQSPAVALISMESLGRPSFSAHSLPAADFVLVDEAHNFRNPSTRRYKRLADLARHARLALLTATPINNSISDLQHLIDLFAAPGAFKHLGISDFRLAFGNAQHDPRAIDPIIGACVLRRTRRFLRAHYGTVEVRDSLTGETRALKFPNRQPPEAVTYDIAGTYGTTFRQLEEWMDALHFPVLGPDPDAEAAECRAPRELLKIILLKRLESSIEAFRSTVIQQLAWCDTALRALDAGRVLTRPDYRAAFRGPADDPGSQLSFFELVLPPTSFEAEELQTFRRLLQEDRSILAKIHRALTSSIGLGSDRKLEALRRLLEGPLAGRKVLLFSEFRDTARYLHRQLRDFPHIARIDSAQARLGQEPATRKDVIERFAPHSNGLPKPPAIERVDILIATDVLSEGLNLQDASVVISYDLPWNPVRLLQRVGRIDRLGSISDSIQLYHFVPASQLERLLGLMRRLRQKVQTIDATLHLDHPVLTSGDSSGIDHIERVHRLATDPSSLETLEDDLDGPGDPEEVAYIDYVSILERPRPLEKVTGPVSAVARGAAIDGPCAYAYWRVTSGTMSRGLWLRYDPTTRCIVEDQAAAIQAFRKAARCASVSAARPDELARARQAAARYAREVVAQLEAARIAGDSLHPGLPQCRIASWLAREFEKSAYRLKEHDRAQIDELLDGLARRFTAESERTLARFASELPERLETAFLEDLSAFLAPLATEDSGPATAHEGATLFVIPNQ